jgi:hypothetical protein
MADKEKSEIRKVVELLEENGYHVFEIKEDLIDHGIATGIPSGAIQVWIAQMKEKS